MNKLIKTVTAEYRDWYGETALGKVRVGVYITDRGFHSAWISGSQFRRMAAKCANFPVIISAELAAEEYPEAYVDAQSTPAVKISNH